MNNKYFNTASENLLNLKKFEKKLDDFSKKIFLLRKKKKILAIIGNGGSCSMADHFSSELNCTYKKKKRQPFKSLTFNSPSSITAWSNDFDFKTYYRRMIDCYLAKGDILLLLSTSGGDRKHGHSSNLLFALTEAKKRKIETYAFLGKSGGVLKKNMHHSKYFLVENKNTSFIQEAHLAMIHYICENLEK